MDSLKVLMIGNSFSICVLKYMPRIAAEAGKKLDLASLYIGGCSFERHSANIFASEFKDFRPYYVSWHYDSLDDQSKVPFASCLGGEDGSHGNIPQLLASDKWDIVTIQQASPLSWQPESYHPWSDLVIKTVRKYAPQAEIYIQQTWSYCNANAHIFNKAENKGPGDWGVDQLGMYEGLVKAYKALSDETGFKVIPTGLAVQLFRERRPVRDVPDDVVGNFSADGTQIADSIHLNRDGEYLQACVWTAKLFGTDVTKLVSVPDDLRHPENAQLLRQCAFDAVKSYK